MLKKRITRREFVQTTVVAATSMALLPSAGCASNTSALDPKDFPTVKLGNTGAVVPVMGFGCGSRWMAVKDDDKALGILEHALNQGLYYWDTASSYGNDLISSEERIGKLLPQYRDRVFLVTKTGDRDAETAKESIERSLSRLNTDHIDLLHIHSINSAEDAEQLGKKGKVLEVLHQYRKEGVIRHIGFTGHASADGMRRAAELYDFDVMMIALNHQSSEGTEKFEENPAHYAHEKGMGVVAMKVIRPRETVKGLATSDLIKYALTLEDFHMINIGMDSMEVLKSNIELIRDFQPLDSQKMNEIRLALQPFYRGERLAWMNPRYFDGWKGELI